MDMIFLITNLIRQVIITNETKGTYVSYPSFSTKLLNFDTFNSKGREKLIIDDTSLTRPHGFQSFKH